MAAENGRGGTTSAKFSILRPIDSQSLALLGDVFSYSANVWASAARTFDTHPNLVDNGESEIDESMRYQVNL